MIVRTDYNVDVFYPADLYPKYDSVIKQIANDFNIEDSGSGMGFGMRDLSYYFDTQTQADEFMTAVRQVKDVVCELIVCTYDENDDIIDSSLINL